MEDLAFLKKLHKIMVAAIRKADPQTPQEQIQCSKAWLIASVDYSAFTRAPEDRDSENQLMNGIEWLTTPVFTQEDNTRGATELMLASLKQMRRKIGEEQITLMDAIEAYTVLLSGLVMLGSTTDNPLKKAAQCESVARAIQKVAIDELSRVYGPLGEMN